MSFTSFNTAAVTESLQSNVTELLLLDAHKNTTLMKLYSLIVTNYKQISFNIYVKVNSEQLNLEKTIKGLSMNLIVIFNVTSVRRTSRKLLFVGDPFWNKAEFMEQKSENDRFSVFQKLQ